MFTLTIDTDSAAFDDDFYNGDAEVARILRAAADSIDRSEAGSFGAEPLILRDANGLAVGEAART